LFGGHALTWVFTKFKLSRSLPGIFGWGSTIAELSTAIWQPKILTGDGRLGPVAGHFGF